MEGGRDGGRERWREGEMEGGRDGGRKRWREGYWFNTVCIFTHTHISYVPAAVVVRVQCLHEGESDVNLLCDAEHNVSELEQVIVAIDVALLPSHFQHIVLRIADGGTHRAYY